MSETIAIILSYLNSQTSGSLFWLEAKIHDFISLLLYAFNSGIWSLLLPNDQNESECPVDSLEARSFHIYSTHILDTVFCP